MILSEFGDRGTAMTMCRIPGLVPLACAITILLVTLMGSPTRAANPLSGTYLLYYEQTFKSCGPKIAPVEVRVSVELIDSTMRVKAPDGFLGINIVEADFDAASGRFKRRVEKRVNLGPTQANLILDLKGRITKQGDKPEIQFEVLFDKVGDDPAWNCKVEGKGRANKV
jgi:hypothetical protein